MPSHSPSSKRQLGELYMGRSEIEWRRRMVVIIVMRGERRKKRNSGKERKRRK